MQQAMEEQERELAEGRRLRDEAQAASDLADSQMQAIADEKEAVRQAKIAKEARLAKEELDMVSDAMSELEASLAERQEAVQLQQQRRQELEAEAESLVYAAGRASLSHRDCDLCHRYDRVGQSTAEADT